MLFRRLKIFHRIVVHGVLLIIAIAIAAISAFHLVEDRPQHETPITRSAVLLIKRLESTNGSVSEIRSTIAPFQYVFDSPIGVFRAGGDLVTIVGGGRIDPLSDTDYRRMIRQKKSPYRRRFAEVVYPLRLPGGPAYLVLTWRHAKEMRARFVFALFIALVVIGLMSVPVARSIAKPVRAIAETAVRWRDGDLTARAKIDSYDEFSNLAHTLNDMAEGLEQRIRREKELLANVSHELRTPLARIRVALELAAESEADSSAVGRHLDEIGQDVQELDQLVGDVLFSTRLDFSPAEGAARFPLKLETVPLVSHLTEAIDKFEADWRCEVRRSLPTSSPVARIDRALFHRVVVNLLSNSYKYSGDDKEISLTLSTTADTAEIAIEDRGMGVSEENLERLFEPFFRTDKSRNRNAGGMGLGLTLAKRIVEAHGGEITARSRTGGGLTVTILLPLAVDASAV